MKITICGSTAFYTKMQEVEKELLALGHEVKIPHAIFTDKNGKDMSIPDAHTLRHTATRADTWVWKEKTKAMFGHYEKIVWSDVILVLNYDKKNIAGYIGGNTFIEMGLAQFLKKNIYLLNEVPEMDYTEEILGMHPVILQGNFSLIK